MTVWLPTLVASLLWVPALVGLGSLPGADVPEPVRVGVSGLLGLAVLAIGALWAGVFLPVSPWVSLALFGAGLASFAWRGRWALARLRTDGPVLLGLAVLVATHAPAPAYDDGLYYLQAAEWIRSSAPIPGLANLHDRFGFNSAWLVEAVALELPGMRGGSPSFAAGLPVILAGTAAAGAIRALWNGDRSFANILFALVAVPAVLGLRGLGSHSADPFVMILGGALVALLALALEGGRWRGAAGPALLLAALAFAAKISSAVSLAGAAGTWVWSVSRAGRKGTRSALAPALWAAALLLPWVARGLLLSGCWLHPAPFSCGTGLPWAVPIEDARQTSAWIRSWARAPGRPPDAVLSSWDWLGPWLGRVASDRVDQWLVVLFGLGLATLAWRRRGPGRVGSLLTALTVAGVAFWWLSAPDPRFGLGYLVSLATLPIALAFREDPAAAPGGRGMSRWLAVTLTGIAAATAAWGLGLAGWTLGGAGLRTSFPRPRVAPVHQERNANGLRAFVPDAGDQCWAAPLPCTPSLRPELRLEGGMLEVKVPTVKAPAVPEPGRSR